MRVYVILLRVTADRFCTSTCTANALDVFAFPSIASNYNNVRGIRKHKKHTAGTWNDSRRVNSGKGQLPRGRNRLNAETAISSTAIICVYFSPEPRLWSSFQLARHTRLLSVLKPRLTWPAIKWGQVTVFVCKDEKWKKKNRTKNVLRTRWPPSFSLL